MEYSVVITKLITSTKKLLSCKTGSNYVLYLSIKNKIKNWLYYWKECFDNTIELKQRLYFIILNIFLTGLILQTLL